MSLFKNFGTGFSAYGKALNIIFTKGLWWYFIFPILLNILFLVGGWLGIGSLSDYVEEWLTGLMSFNGDSFTGASFLEPIAGYLSGIAGVFVWIILKFAFFFVFATIGGYIVIIFLSPVFAFLSERTEEILTGNKYPFNGDQLMRDVVRGILVALRNMFIELGYMVVIFLLGLFIPVIGGIIGTIILFFIASYFYGFAFIDYTNERRRLSIKESVKFIRAHKGMAIAIGMIFSFFMLIPFCGTTLAGFAAIVSVVAATVATHKVVDLSKNPHAQNKNSESSKEGEEIIEDAVIVTEEDQKKIVEKPIEIIETIEPEETVEEIDTSEEVKGEEDKINEGEIVEEKSDEEDGAEADNADEEGSEEDKNDEEGSEDENPEDDKKD